MKKPMQYRSLISGIRGRVAAAVTLAISLGLAALPAGAQNFTTFDAPSAGTGKLQGTIAISINTAGAITGIVYDSSTLAHGFVRPANGATPTTFNAPGAGTGLNQGTFPTSINTAGTVVGMYANSGNVYHGFVRASNGTITLLDVPVAGSGKHQGTVPISINTAGAIAGMYKDSSSQYHGFVLPAKATTPTTFDAPGAGTGYAVGTIPIGINTAGAIVGYYVDQSSGHHGFVRTADGATITPIDAPGAGTGSGRGTIAISINTAGTITGEYTDASGLAHGFVRAVGGKITTFDAPGAGTAGWLASLVAHESGGGPALQGTDGFSINTAGEIAGGYGDTGTVFHGYVRATNGTITTFNVPTAGTGALEGTTGFSINTAGDVAGTYADANSVFHGFVLAPPTATATTLGAAPNPSTFGQTVTLTATVTPKSGTIPNGETVSFLKGTTVLGTGTLSGGSASMTTSTLKVGTNAIKAEYGGDANFAASTSKPVSQVVDKATTTTTLVSSLNPSNSGQSVTFTATVKPEFSGTATGSVTFDDGTTLLKTVSLSGGVAKFTTTKLASGKHSISATYNGSTSFDGSTGSLTQTVN